MPIDWKLPEDYEDQRGEAQQRISHRDPDDWPTVALALKLESAISCLLTPPLYGLKL
ncbi:MAG TPA: PIN domain-containing protein [Solirubrobacteraceae bacterium]|jgi:predicted nucleic acid-binding protein|nr:PIN domain-containing protein [Solirubrobacteraceae bacterium]